MIWACQRASNSLLRASNSLLRASNSLLRASNSLLRASNSLRSLQLIHLYQIKLEDLHFVSQKIQIQLIAKDLHLRPTLPRLIVKYRQLVVFLWAQIHYADLPEIYYRTSSYFDSFFTTTTTTTVYYDSFFFYSKRICRWNSNPKYRWQKCGIW